MILSALSLTIFKNAYVALYQGKKIIYKETTTRKNLFRYSIICIASSGGYNVPRGIRPGFRFVYKWVETLIGTKAVDLKITLTQIIFMCSVLMLIAIYNTLTKANELKAKEVAALSSKKQA